MLFILHPSFLAPFPKLDFTLSERVSLHLDDHTLLNPGRTHDDIIKLNPSLSVLAHSIVHRVMCMGFARHGSAFDVVCESVL